MSGAIYIAGAYAHPDCPRRRRGAWPDNDPHFLCDPPTWGICRPDLRANARAGDFIFFVLPRWSALPQMIFAYLKVKEIITHHEAFHRPDLHRKRMLNIRPDGNILADKDGAYNPNDLGWHKGNFEKIKRCYAVGDPASSRYLSGVQIRRKAPEFLNVLEALFGCGGQRAIEYISRKGRHLTAEQAQALVDWLR